MGKGLLVFPFNSFLRTATFVGSQLLSNIQWKGPGHLSLETGKLVGDTHVTLKTHLFVRETIWAITSAVHCLKRVAPAEVDFIV